MPTFSRLELQNFKSYRLHTIFQWMQVSAILGENGTGKSTVVDAVEYVFCFPRFTKSVSRLRQELYNKNSDKNEHSSSWVSATVNINNVERVFKRSLDYNTSTHKYWVDGNLVDLNKYKQLLLEVNVDPRANHFLIQQNTIEKLAIMKAKQRAQHFEILSNSIAHKPEYDRLKKEMESMKPEVQKLHNSFKAFEKDKKMLVKKSKEIRVYDDLKQQIEKLEYDYYYLKLYKCQIEIEDLREKQKETEKTKTINQKIADEYKTAIEKLKQKINKKEEEKSEIERVLERNQQSDYKMEGVRLKEEITNLENEIEKVSKQLKIAKNLQKSSQKELEKLESQKRDVEEEKKQLVDLMRQTRSFDLNEKQYQKYYDLKEEVQKQFAKEISTVSSLERECKGLLDQIDYYQQRKHILSNERVIAEKAYHTNTDLYRNVKQKFEDTKLEIENLEREEMKNDKEIEKLKADVEETNECIQSINQKLNECDVDDRSSRQEERQNKILNILRDKFGTKILGRLVQLCRINDDKYKIAITRILSNQMNWIIVDTNITAQECISFLKYHFAGDKSSAFATFMPLDISNQKIKFLNKKIIDEIGMMSGARLAVDVMDAGRIDNILQFLIGRTVICDTNKQASNLSSKFKINCVSLEGTYYNKDGSFTGGFQDMRDKAKGWSAEECEKLRREKKHNTEALRKIQLEIKDKLDCKNNLHMKLENLRNRLETYLEPTLKEYNVQLKKSEDDLEKAIVKLETFETENGSFLQDAEKSLEVAKNKLSELKKRQSEIEDQVFSGFCKKLKIKNIRQFEESDLRHLEELTKRKLEIDNHLDRIQNQIDYERSRKTEETVKLYKDKKEKLDKELKDVLSKLVKWENRKNENDEASENEERLQLLKSKIDKLKRELKLKERELSRAKDDLKIFENNIRVIASKIKELKRFEIHRILKMCKMKGIDIPLQEGTIENVVLASKIVGTESDGSSSQETESESAILEQNVEVDFTNLDNSKKNLKDIELDDLIESQKSEMLELEKKLESCIPTNRDLKLELQSIESQIKSAKEVWTAKSGELATIMKSFEEVRLKRVNSFTTFYNAVNQDLEETFRNLYGNATAHAVMTVTNPEEPYLDGIQLSCVIPNKKFVKIEELSGGEKTMIVIALFLATFKAKPAPCIIFDEIDAALDKFNLENVVTLFALWKLTTQIITISHQDRFLKYADAAIGINVSHRENSSYVVHIDLTTYLQPINKNSKEDNNDSSSSASKILHTSVSSPSSSLPRITSFVTIRKRRSKKAQR